MLQDELADFRGSEEREAAVTLVEEGAVWEGCGRSEEVAGLIWGVVERVGEDEVGVAEVVEAEEGAMGFDVERPRNMGLPWGFSILPVN